jgi:hypothetical protein
MTTESPESSTVKTYIQFPSFYSQLTHSLLFIFKRYDVTLLGLLIGIVSVLPIILTTLVMTTVELAWLVPVTLVATFATAPLAIIGGMMAIHISSSLNENISLLASLKFVLRNFFSIVWISLLGTIIIYGALLFLIIPGLIVAGYFVLIFAVFVNEGKTGMAAILRSHQLIRGHGVFLFNRLIGLLLFVIVLLVVPSVIIELGPVQYIITQTIIQSIAGILLYKMLGEFYKVLYNKPIAGTPPFKVYKFFLIAGTMLIIGIIVLSLYFISLGSITADMVTM